MTAKALEDVLQRVEAWPEEAQEQLVEITREIDAQIAGGVYHATASELEALDEAERSGVASEAKFEAAFGTFRRARRSNTASGQRTIFARCPRRAARSAKWVQHRSKNASAKSLREIVARNRCAKSLRIWSNIRKQRRGLWSDRGRMSSR
jgi:uncharacterized FlgJ-related protein